MKKMKSILKLKYGATYKAKPTAKLIDIAHIFQRYAKRNSKVQLITRNYFQYEQVGTYKAR